MNLQNDHFSKATSKWVHRHGTPPPASVFSAHPAHEPLAEAIRQTTRRKFRGVRKFHHAWSEEAAQYVLQSLARDDDNLTEGGVTADEMDDDLHSTPFTANGCNAAISRVVRDLLGDTPPATNGPLLAAWQAVRGVPAPSLSHWRDVDADPVAEARARLDEIKARSKRNA